MDACDYLIPRLIMKALNFDPRLFEAAPSRSGVLTTEVSRAIGLADIYDYLLTLLAIGQYSLLSTTGAMLILASHHLLLIPLAFSAQEHCAFQPLTSNSSPVIIRTRTK